MNTRLIAGVAIIILIAAGLFAWQKYGVPLNDRVAAGPGAGGVEYVYITSIAPEGQDVIVSIAHITYFDGEEATLSAEQEVACDAAIETCVPTLARGYYIRPSGAEQESLSLSPTATFSLLTKEQAQINDLTGYLTGNKTEPVFTITRVGDQITDISEVNHL